MEAGAAGAAASRRTPKETQDPGTHSVPGAPDKSRADPAGRDRPLQRRTQEKRLGVGGSRRGWGGGGADDGGMLDDVELGIFLIEIGLALGLDGALFFGGSVGVSIV